MILCMKPLLRIFGLAAAIALSGCASTLDLDGALAVAPYRIDDSGIIIVAARVDGEGPYNFALDTGASISAVFDVLRKELKLETDPGIKVIVHGAVASGQFPLLDIDRLEIGGEVWANPRIVSLPGETEIGARVDGVLGIDFLRRYAIGFLANDRFVRLYPPDLVARRSYRGWASVPLKAQSVGEDGPALYTIDVEIAGRKMPAVFDLGAGLNMINWPGALSLGFKPRLRQRDDLLYGAIESLSNVPRFIVDEVSTANIRWRDEVFSVADLEIFETLQFGDNPAAILGAGLFIQRDFVIDFVRNRLLVRVAMDELKAHGSAATRPAGAEATTLLSRDAGTYTETAPTN